MMEGVESGAGEILLFDAEDNLTEAAACNVLVVTKGVVRTPALDNHKLAGVTRDMALAVLRHHSSIEVREETISRQDVMSADEVWLSS